MKTVIEMAREAGMNVVDDQYSLLPFLERFAELVRDDEREAIRDEWHSCVMSDLEHGVKCLNEQAAIEWHKNYPAQSKMFPEWLEARGNNA